MPMARARRSSIPSISSSVTPRQEAALAAAKDISTLQLLFKAARLVDERAVARARTAPEAARLRTAHTALLPHLDFTGVRLTDLAAKVGVTKQAVAQLVDDLEAMGAVERVPDPDDGRAKRIRLSQRGHAAILHGLGVLRQLEAELADQIGQRRMDELRRSLQAVLAVVDGVSDTSRAK
jgi:DNA-binding MarR family transcriptional regulator